MSDRRCVRCIVSGLVQGVWFRATTQRQANHLGLTGKALNLPDGRVEVVACGDADKLDVLQDWLWQGPDLAQVTDVRCEALPFSTYEGFHTG